MKRGVKTPFSLQILDLRRGLHPAPGTYGAGCKLHLKSRVWRHVEPRGRMSGRTLHKGPACTARIGAGSSSSISSAVQCPRDNDARALFIGTRCSRCLATHGAHSNASRERSTHRLPAVPYYTLLQSPPTSMRSRGGVACRV